MVYRIRLSEAAELNAKGIRGNLMGNRINLSSLVRENGKGIKPKVALQNGIVNAAKINAGAIRAKINKNKVLQTAEANGKGI